MTAARRTRSRLVTAALALALAAGCSGSLAAQTASIAATASVSTTALSIASSSHNTYEVAVNTNKSQLWLATPTAVRSTTLGLRAGTPPTILAV